MKLKAGRPKKLAKSNIKVPFKLIQEIKFEIYSTIRMGKTITFTDDWGIKKQGILVGATIGSKTTTIKEYIVNVMDTNAYTYLCGNNEYVPDHYLRITVPGYKRREIKRGSIKRVPSKNIIKK